MSIGKIVGNVQGKLVETLLIGGKSVGLGYKNLVKKSMSVFVYDPYGNDGSSKLYNSGDQARFLETGDLAFLGRNDDQVKISGQRVELGAVESGMLACKGVKGCAVVVIVDQGTGNKSLAAFAVVGKEDAESVTAGSIREEVSGKVARHEVPHRIVVVESIPVTTAGKADRAALRKFLSSSVVEVQNSRRTNGKGLKKGGQSKSKSLKRSASRNILKYNFKKLTGNEFNEGQSIWDQGVTSLNAMMLDSFLEKEVGIKVGMSNMLRDGSLDGLAKVLDDAGLLNPQKHSSQERYFTARVESFGRGPKVLMFISSYGLPSESSPSFIRLMKEEYEVLVFSFCGLDKGPEELAKNLLGLVDNRKLARVEMVCAHSAGGGTAFEICKLLEEREIAVKFCLLDCYIPRSQKALSEDVLRFFMNPFLEMKGKSGIGNVPKDFLEDIFITLLQSFGYSSKESETLYELCSSEENVSMIEKINNWRPEGVLNCEIYFIRSSSSPEELGSTWQSYFSRSIEECSVTEDHFGMLESSATILLEK
jgi:hypothetical protein